MPEEEKPDANENSNSERAEHAHRSGEQDDKVTSAAQEATESVTSTVETAVEKAEDAAEEVAEAVLEAATTAAEKNDVPELAGQVADIVITRLREAGLTVADVTEETTDAAQEVAEQVSEAAVEAVEEVVDVTDSIAPTSGHFWYAWPPKMP